MTFPVVQSAVMSVCLSSAAPSTRPVDPLLSLIGSDGIRFSKFRHRFVLVFFFLHTPGLYSVPCFPAGVASLLALSFILRPISPCFRGGALVEAH